MSGSKLGSRKKSVGPNSDVLENSTFFSKPVGPISHVFVGPNSYKSGGTRHVPPFNLGRKKLKI